MYYFIVNEGARSGKGRLVWQKICAELNNRKIPYLFRTTEYAGHARVLAKEITSQYTTDLILIAVGGDGTVNEVLNGIQDFSKVTFAVVPVGSGNDFSRGLKLAKNPMDCLLHILDHGEEMQMDLGSVCWTSETILGVTPVKQKRLFAISAGIGMDALVSRKALTSNLKKYLNKLHLGKLTYLLLTVETLFTMQTTSVSLIFPGHNPLTLKKMIFLAGMNFRAEGGGVPMAPHADAFDGKLDLCIAYGIPKWVTFFLLPLLVMAKHEHIPGFHIFRKSTCRIHTDVPMVVHTDGEYCGTFNDVTFSCMKQKLHILK